ncbi:hypothetical protein [Labedaea rhizosphaerae]|jgi:hypothetical protein|uniref:Uncharacterized protein n=1 Tax=Labedaea rhizosphaerae TaxID=598644 RepID=A0A4V3CX73_LABRH|nr:hypothetical protein [Labedaea rhizosphaerae]TDP89178.1 hypothetical protein EV186_1142 [Labedaea rhizosphaerae]
MLIIAQMDPPTGLESWALRLVVLAGLVAALVLAIRAYRSRR